MRQRKQGCVLNSNQQIQGLQHAPPLESRGETGARVQTNTHHITEGAMRCLAIGVTSPRRARLQEPVLVHPTPVRGAISSSFTARGTINKMPTFPRKMSQVITFSSLNEPRGEPQLARCFVLWSKTARK